MKQIKLCFIIKGYKILLESKNTNKLESKTFTTVKSTLSSNPLRIFRENLSDKIFKNNYR